MASRSMTLAEPAGAPQTLQAAGRFLLRYGLVLILLWIGGMKFTAYEAEGIKPLVESSPLMSWLYRFLSVQAVSNLLGVTEILIGLMIALRPVAPRLCALGSALAIPMFLTTLSFLFTLPGWEATLGGFLLKEVLLLGVAVWSLGEALGAAAVSSHHA